MRAAVLAAVVLVFAGLLAGCGTRHNPRTLTSFPPYPRGIQEYVPPTSSMERHWLARLGSSKTFPHSGSGPIGIRIRADKLTESIRRAVQEPDVHILSLRIYSTPKLASWLTPALYLEVSRPAYSLRHQFKAVIPLLTKNRSAYYLRVDGGRIGHRVLESSSTPHWGAWYIAHGLESCNPISTIPGGLALGGRVSPCPSK